MAFLQDFYANMDWWEVAEQPPINSAIAKIFQKCKDKWDSSDKGKEEVKTYLSSFLKSKFLICNISNNEDIFDISHLDDELEVPAVQVVLVGLDFSVHPVPLCKSEAYFSVPVKREFFEKDFSEWQEQNSYFTDAISFYWEFDSDLLNQCDLSFGSHSGVECIPLSK